MTFTVGGYVEMISKILDHGYRIRRFDDFDAAQPDLILRHDIDFDPEIALEIAEAESKKGWRSSYFVLTRSEFYNLAAPRCRKAIKKLQELGHGVGLHFDASIHPASPDALIEAVNRESDWIESITGSPVDVFSLHRPHPDLLENTLTVPGKINAYAPGLFHDIGYVSDSRGAWHHGNPLDHKSVAAGHALQLLTHPIWWTSDPTYSAHEKCAAFLAARSEFLDLKMRTNCSAYHGSETPNNQSATNS
jgi:hypothetical protein